MIVYKFNNENPYLTTSVSLAFNSYPDSYRDDIRN
jgi:hypothetical protein